MICHFAETLIYWIQSSFRIP